MTVASADPFTWTSVKSTDGRIRSVSAHLADGRPTVRDGKFVENGAPTPWQTRCR